MFRSISSCLCLFVSVTFLLPGNGILPGDGGRADGAEAAANMEQVIRRGLDKPVTLKVIETPLNEVAENLAKQAGIPNIQLDTRAMEDVGLGCDTPITRNLKGITLRSTLRLVLDELDLTFVIRDEVLLITTPEEAETSLRVQIFDVMDLVQLHDDALPEEYDYDALMELIMSVVGPTTWVDVGGAGSINGFRGTLVVSQTQEVLDEITPLLDTVRKARKITGEHGKKTPPVTSIWASPPRVEAIDRALLKKGSYDFKDAPLQDVVDFLQKTFEVPIQIDLRALEDMGIGSDTPVTFAAKDLPLRQALRLILRQFDLTFMQYCSVLLITTLEEAESTLATRVYLVGDLLGGVSASVEGDNVNFDCADYDALIELTTATVAPTSWVDVGGSGTIEEVPFGLCVVSQTAHIHQEIEQLFAKLRETIPRENVEAAEGDGSGLRLVVYFVGSDPQGTGGMGGTGMMSPNTTPQPGTQPKKTDSSSSPAGNDRVLAMMGGGMGFVVSEMFDDQELLELIQELVEPDSWDAEGVFARAAAGRLIIRQTDDVHRQIRRMLTRLGVNYSDSAQAGGAMQGFFGGMGGMGGGGMGGGFGGGNEQGGFF